MARLHLIEFGDQPWCPAVFRDATTALLEFVVGNVNCYAPVLPLITQALQRSGSHEIVDLCSGGGGPWRKLLRDAPEQLPVRVLLTDRFPNLGIAHRLARLSNGRIVVEARSVDALDVAPGLRGFRTMFTAFHHFPPAQASAILQDAVRARASIGIFEFTERSPLGLFALFFTPLAVFACVPLLRPFRWSWVVFTYVMPVIPLITLFDGLVSCLRTYSPQELRRLVDGLGATAFEWEIGKVRSWRSPLPITYLIGQPADPA